MTKLSERIRPNSEAAPWVIEEVRTLESQLELNQKIVARECEDWAEDHTHLQNLCKNAGVPEDKVEGDSYGVPGIQELADMLEAKLKESQESERITKIQLDMLRQESAARIKRSTDMLARTDSALEACRVPKLSPVRVNIKSCLENT